MPREEESSARDAGLRKELHQRVRTLTGESRDYDSLVELAGEARFALLGEASHGTHEFYGERARLTRRLIEEKGFAAVAIEGDWPDAERVNRFVRGQSDDASASESLLGFRRFPTWMWCNADVLDFVGWLRQRNDGLKAGARKAGFYGLDLYSLHASIASVLDYLDRVDPEAARRARYRYGCFERFGEDTQAYGYAASFDLSESCENQVVRQLVDLRASALEYASRDGRTAFEALFSAEQNARLVANAERYYREMFRGRVSSWNLRDSHMVETLETLARHLESFGEEPKIVVWAHNSHLGDARATEMGERGEWNIGQLLRERHGTGVFSVGFTTHAGTVTAASEWDAPAERKRVRPSRAGSYEALFHAVGLPRFLLLFRGDGAPRRALLEPRLERAIGVIYLPESERASHYFSARLPDQFDAVLHFDQTRAVEPLEVGAEWPRDEVPETYPSAL
jgi:erythromycin esterase-like protein